MSVISRDELRTRVEWSRNNGSAGQEAGGGIRFEHEGKTYSIPAELLVSQDEGSDPGVELSQYEVAKR